MTIDFPKIPTVGWTVSWCGFHEFNVNMFDTSWQLNCFFFLFISHLVFIIYFPEENLFLNFIFITQAIGCWKCSLTSNWTVHCCTNYSWTAHSIFLLFKVLILGFCLLRNRIFNITIVQLIAINLRFWMGLGILDTKYLHKNLWYKKMWNCIPSGKFTVTSFIWGIGRIHFKII